AGRLRGLLDRPPPALRLPAECGKLRRATGPGRSAGSARCKRGTAAIQRRSAPASPGRRSSSVRLSSETQVADLSFFAGWDSFFAGAVPFVLLVPLAPSLSLEAGLVSSALAPALYDSLR